MKPPDPEIAFQFQQRGNRYHLRRAEMRAIAGGARGAVRPLWPCPSFAGRG